LNINIMKVDLTLLKRIHESISREATGRPDNMAKKLDISKRFLHAMIDFLKQELGAPIAYSRMRETYYYTEEWDFFIGNLSRIKADLIKAFLEAINKKMNILFLIGFFWF